MTKDQAAIIALAGIEFLAEQPEWMDRFFAVSGLGSDDLRDRLNDNGLQAGVLAFLMSDDALAQPFCEAQKRTPQELMLAQYRLETP